MCVGMALRVIHNGEEFTSETDSDQLCIVLSGFLKTKYKLEEKNATSILIYF